MRKKLLIEFNINLHKILELDKIFINNQVTSWWKLDYPGELTALLINSTFINVFLANLISKVNCISFMYEHISFSTTQLRDNTFAACETLENSCTSYMISMNMCVHCGEQTNFCWSVLCYLLVPCHWNCKTQIEVIFTNIKLSWQSIN